MILYLVLALLKSPLILRPSATDKAQITSNPIPGTWGILSSQLSVLSRLSSNEHQKEDSVPEIHLFLLPGNASGDTLREQMVKLLSGKKWQYYWNTAGQPPLLKYRLVRHALTPGEQRQAAVDAAMEMVKKLREAFASDAGMQALADSDPDIAFLCPVILGMLVVNY